MRVLAVLLLLATCFTSALADGKFFRNQLIEAEPTIPFQRAVLKFDGREQIMLVESTLKGPQGDYGWVVPLPSKPSYVKAVNPAYVEESFRQVMPPIQSGRGIEPVVAVGIVLFALIALTSGLRYKNRELGTRILFFGMEVGILLIVAMFLFPVFAQAKLAAAADAASASAKGANVESLGTVGSYEVSVISGESGQEIVDWLHEHKISVSEKELPVIEAYAKEGWCFLAAEIRKDEQTNYPPHPLKAVFPTDRLVYPMRLTGLQDEPLHLELLVVSDKQAAVPGMKAWACDNAQIVVPVGISSNQDKEIYSDWQSGRYAMAKHGAVWTYLRGEIKPADMKKDFLVGWKPMERQRLQVWDKEHATSEAIEIGFLALIATSVVVGLVLSCWPRVSEKIFAVGVAIALLSATSSGAYWYESVEKVDSTEVAREH